MRYRVSPCARVWRSIRATQPVGAHRSTAPGRSPARDTCFKHTTSIWAMARQRPALRGERESRIAAQPAERPALGAAPGHAPVRARQGGYGCRVRSERAAGSRTVITPAVVIWRAAHALIAIGFLSSIGYVWWCALTGRRARWLRLAIAALAGEGVLIVTNGGDCPLGPLGDRIGDQVPLFELVLSPRAARLAVPALGGVTALGVGILAARSRRVPATAARAVVQAIHEV